VDHISLDFCSAAAAAAAPSAAAPAARSVSFPSDTISGDVPPPSPPGSGGASGGSGGGGGGAASVGRWLPGWWPPCLGGSRRSPRRRRPLPTRQRTRQEPHVEVFSGSRPLGEYPPRRRRLPLVRAADDAAAAVCGATSAPATGGDVGDRRHRRHGHLPRLQCADLPLVRALPSGTGRAGDREAVLDSSIYLSSCENGFIVSPVQGVFAYAISA